MLDLEAKQMKMDGGSEYLDMFKAFLEGNGIDVDTTARYSPESNGISEHLKMIENQRILL
jgi:hypothetical protein